MQIRKHVAARVHLLWAGSSRTWSIAGIALGNLLLILLVHFHHRFSGEMKRKSGSQKREEADLNHGVVENSGLSLASWSIAILELTTNSTVTSRNGDTTSKHTAGLHDDCRADPGESTVDERWRTATTELVGVGVNVCVLRQHADVWDLDLVEQKEAVVHCVVTKLGTNVTNVDVLERLVCLQITDLDAEGRGSVGLAVDDELRHNYRVVGCAAERADPPLTGRQMRRVDCEGLVVGVPGSSSLKTTDVGTMAKLSLSIAADDLVVVGQSEPLLLLFGRSLSLKSDLEMALVCIDEGDASIHTLNMESWRP